MRSLFRLLAITALLSKIASRMIGAIGFQPSMRAL